MDKSEKLIVIIAMCLIYLCAWGIYLETKATEKQLAQKTIEAENWKTLYQLSEK